MTVKLLADDPHDDALRRAVHPSDWVNPTPAPLYSLVVLGAGTAGLVTAAGAAGLGAKVALVERDLMGGDCLNVGCVPSKALLRAARAAAEVRDAGRFGVHVPDGTRVDFAAVMERMRTLRAGLSPHDSATRFRDLGIDVFLGDGRFVGPDSLAVGGATLRFRKAVLATGGRPVRPAIPGLSDFDTNETVFARTALPRRLAVVGAGPIGCELAQAFARFGATVHLIGRESRVLPRDDADAAEIVRRALERDGIALHLGTEIERADSGVLRLRNGATVEADAVLMAAGRVPNVEGLGLDAAGVAFDAKIGVRVDDRLRTTNRRIFAAGDVGSRYKFTHAADAMARLAIRNALFLGRGRASALTIPWCTYTDPEVAHVGLSPAEAAERGVKVQTFVQEFAKLDRAILDGDEGFMKVHVHAGTDRIVGATVVARHAGDLIAPLVLAMTHGLGLGKLSATVLPYPTQAEAVRKLGDAYNRTRLTPLVKRLFAWWLRV